jgi:hypothetical protein
LHDVSIIPNSVYQSDPRQMLYHFPSMSAVKYAKMASTFYHWKMVQTAEELVKIHGQYLIPSSCIHWKRKEDIDLKKKIKIGKHVYYILRLDEMTDKEKEKFYAYLEEKDKVKSIS